MRRIVMLAGAVLLLLAACNNDKATNPTTRADTVDLPTTTQPAATTPAPVVLTPAAPGAPVAFLHEKATDFAGYFLPSQPVKVGKWKLSDLSIGPEDELAKWEAGTRTATYAPVMLEFDDMTSPTKANELGQQVHTVRIRVLPTTYALGPGGAVHFTAKDANLGDVQFDGTVDAAALTKLRAAGPNGGPQAIVKGDLMLGTTPFKALSFTWFGGD